MPSPGDSAKPADDAIEVPSALPVNTVRVVEVGMALWAVALVVVLAVPALREGDRDWWVWCPVAGILLGALGWVYVRRGRGNAAEA